MPFFLIFHFTKYYQLDVNPSLEWVPARKYPAFDFLTLFCFILLDLNQAKVW